MRGAVAPGGVLGKALATVVTLAGAVLVFTLSLAMFAVLLVLGLGFGGYLWWKTRALRRALREQQAGLAAAIAAHEAAHTAPVGTVIEGEFLRVDEFRRELPVEQDGRGGSVP